MLEYPGSGRRKDGLEHDGRHIMREIFDRQWQLNIHTLANIGKDFEETMRDPEERLVWIENYRKALSAELAELIREVEEYGIGTRNGKIEIIDMLHFLVSLSQIVGVGPEETPSFSAPAHGLEFDRAAVQAFLALDELQNSLKWKWWAKGGGFKPEKARGAVLAFWGVLAGMCGIFALRFPELKQIYIAKNQVNFQRQHRNYNEDTKTEADNLAIEIR